VTDPLNDISSAEAGYQSFFRDSPCPMWILDPQTVSFLDVNDAALRQYGYSREEFLKLDLSAMRAMNDTERVIKILQDRNDRDFFDAGISLHKRKNGETFYVHVYAQHAIFKGKRVRLSMLINQNEKIIAEHKNKELYEIIRSQKEQLDNILSSIEVVIWSKRTDTFQTVYVNNACKKVYGYEPGEMIADKNIFSQLVYPDDKAIYLQAIKTIIETGSAEYEVRAYHKDGSLRHLKTSAMFVMGKEGIPDTITGFTEDITEERTLQQKIKEDKRNLRALIDNTEDFIWSVDKNLKYISINQAHVNFILGLTGKNIKPGDNSSAYDLKNEDRDTWLGYYSRALEGEAFIAVQEIILNDRKAYFEIHFHPIFNELDEITGVSCFSRNITERRAHLLKMESQNERLKDIAWMQSHKIRNHVAIILGLSQLLKHNDTEEDNTDIVDGIKNAAAELDAVIKQINTMTRDKDVNVS
jgi:PAS domain S-box-containing protein